MYINEEGSLFIFAKESETFTLWGGFEKEYVFDIKSLLVLVFM